VLSGVFMVHSDWALACVRDGLAAWNRRDWSGLESIYATEVVYESPYSLAVGRTAVRDRQEQLVTAIPDLRWSRLRMIENDCVQNRATFESRQTGTFARTVQTEGATFGNGSVFVVNTTLSVRFDADGRVASLRTSHTPACERVRTVRPSA
jgi:predicted ester cyclase